MSDAVHIKHFNRALRAAEPRARELEDRLVDVLTPVLEKAGRVAARRFKQMATDHLNASAALRRADVAALAQWEHADDALGVQVSRLERAQMLGLTAAGGLDGVQSTSTMVCVKPRPEEADEIADPDGAAPEDLHVTLAGLGEVEGELAEVLDALRSVAAAFAPLVGRVGGYGQFRPPGCGILLPDVPGLVELRVAVTEALVAAGVDYGRDHGFQPHITVDGSPEPDEAEMMLAKAGLPLHFDALLLVRGDVLVAELPLAGVPALTASAPLSSFCLPAELRTKTDPVRQAAAETMARETLKGVGLSFDVTNPLIGKGIASTGANIQSISQTTQADVMRVIRASYEQGLSIPDTAKAIQSKMADVAPVRARLIARTEMAGATNAASLAAARVVSGSLEEGNALYKQWMTAGGAPYPRHEDYDGLDGQTVGLNDLFNVGDSQLDCPGDPNGDPAEVCNCRCTMSYTDDADELTSSGAVLAHRCERVRLDTAETLRALERQIWSITAGADPTWTAPAAEEVLPIGCALIVPPTGNAAGTHQQSLGVPKPSGESLG